MDQAEVSTRPKIQGGGGGTAHWAPETGVPAVFLAANLASDREDGIFLTHQCLCGEAEGKTLLGEDMIMQTTGI